jgi:23S rRNA (adenine2503-C2)-methyltransferase
MTRELTPQLNLLGLSSAELEDFAERIGEPRYRGRQVFRWLYTGGARDFRGMSDLGKDFRALLEQTAVISGITPLSQRVSAADGTTKFLFGLADGGKIESVLIPPASAFRDPEAAVEDEQRRLTLCVSTQVGCPLACAFCATGTMGFTRNLTAGEIVDQLLQVRRLTGRDVTNIVFMGMGEPMLNYDSVMAAAGVFVHGKGIAARRITISTAGWADRIRQMGDERRRLKLAVSLHSVVDRTRTSLMPITKRFPVDALLAAVDHYYRKTRQRVTYEVILFDGLNDGNDDVRMLITFARRVPCKINVIPYHPIDFAAPTGIASSLRPSRRLDEILERLRAAKLTVLLRSSAGEDIEGACGQLAIVGRPT